ncbi:MAG: HPr kinase/phosphorylase [Verrucomicrobia bacterium]|nr:HPr kinase/phosphorylase [Verrucomicrobiota bacterium]
MYHVKELYEKYQETLALSLLAGEEGLSRPVRVPEAHRPGLGLAGHLKEYVNQRILVLGSVEVSYLRDLEEEVRKERIQGILTAKTPTVVIAGRFSPPKELLQFCDENALPLLRTKMKTVEFLTRLTFLLNEDFSPNMTCHGTLVEAFGIGVLIQGDSSIGKSEAALGLIERGHRLISDDVVKIKLREGAYLEGSGPELTRHLLEIRGIGIINVAHLYGAVCVRDYKRVDLIVKLESWDDKKFYDQVGLDQQFCDVLGKKVPFHILPVKPGRDVVLLIETITLNYRLKEMGFNSAKDFNVKLLEAIAKKQGQVGKNSESVL